MSFLRRLKQHIQKSARFRTFYRHKRGFVSTFLLLFVLIAVSGAEFWCGSNPLLISYDKQWYTPVFCTYTEKDFGGAFDLPVDYRDPEFQTQIHEKGGWMLWPLVPYDASSVMLDRQSPAPPSAQNWLGTDDQGRDVLARLVYGLRTSLLFGGVLALFSALFALCAGSVQGYFGGKIDFFLQRFTEVWSGLPVLFLLIILGGFVRPDFWWLLLVMLPFSWMGLASLVRAEFLRVRRQDYIRAAQALGVPALRIMWRHALPNALVATVSYLPFLISHAISTLTSLDFLGFGLPVGAPSLGELLQQGKNNLHAPWLGITSFFGIASVLALVTFMGEAVRDALDPRG